MTCLSKHYMIKNIENSRFFILIFNIKCCDRFFNLSFCTELLLGFIHAITLTGKAYPRVTRWSVQICTALLLQVSYCTVHLNLQTAFIKNVILPTAKYVCPMQVSCSAVHALEFARNISSNCICICPKYNMYLSQYQNAFVPITKNVHYTWFTVQCTGWNLRKPVLGADDPAKAVSRRPLDDKRKLPQKIPCVSSSLVWEITL